MANSSVAAMDSGPTHQQWTLLGSSVANGGMDVYVAPASIRRSGDRARMFDLFDFKTRQAFEGKPFLSARNEFEYDCARSRQRMLGTTGYAGSMGHGAVVASSTGASPWEPVGTSGPNFDHWRVACKRR